jgi:hypothetical protein
MERIEIAERERRIYQRRRSAPKYWRSPPKKILCLQVLTSLVRYTTNDQMLQKHIDAVMNYPLVDIAAIKKAKFYCA